MNTDNIAFTSHQGPRDDLEDRAAGFELRLAGPTPVHAVLGILADGVGGHQYGEVAAELTVRHVRSFVQTIPTFHRMVCIAQPRGKRILRCFAQASRVE